MECSKLNGCVVWKCYIRVKILIVTKYHHKMHSYGNLKFKS